MCFVTEADRCLFKIPVVIYIHFKIHFFDICPKVILSFFFQYTGIDFFTYIHLKKTPAKSPKTLFIFFSYVKIFYFQQYNIVYILTSSTDTVQVINLTAH